MTVELQDELRVAQELLFLVVNEVGPIELDIAGSRELILGDKMIDFQLNSDKGTMTLSIVKIPQEVTDEV